MKFILIFLGILMVLSGVGILINPEIITDIFAGNEVDSSLYIGVIVFRLIFGFLLVWTAKLSKYPRVITIFGYLAIFAAVIFILIGHDGFQNFMSEIIPVLMAQSQTAGLLSIAFGGFLIYAYSGEK
ncbi:MAG: hypothetical protein KAJ23_17525 [Maribacter sp.]|nr:hypothetical protein [Maribacter sp.]